MDMSVHSLNTLFDPLGLPSSDKDIEHFVSTHRLYRGDIKMTEATLGLLRNPAF